MPLTTEGLFVITHDHSTAPHEDVLYNDYDEACLALKNVPQDGRHYEVSTLKEALDLFTEVAYIGG